ncbi:MAG: protein TolR [Myxococcota bacterium]|nr:protein TolR [Myxococcota bacterium]
MAEINVTPFVDVMLVLLVIFMVTAPLIQQGVPVELPKTKSEGLRSREEPLVIAVDRSGTIFVQRAKVTPESLEGKLIAIFETRGNKEVFLRADARASYGEVARVLATMQRAGAAKIGMVTEPEA